MNHLRLLLIVVKKDSLIANQIFHIAKTIKNLFMCKYFLINNQPYLAVHTFLESNINYHISNP